VDVYGNPLVLTCLMAARRGGNFATVRVAARQRAQGREFPCICLAATAVWQAPLQLVRKTVVCGAYRGSADFAAYGKGQAQRLSSAGA